MTGPDPDRYRLQVAGPAARALARRLPRKIAAAVYEFITTALLDNPHRDGNRLLLPPFEGTWSARRGTYRVLYEIYETDRVVTVTAIENRADAYRSANSRPSVSDGTSKALGRQ